MFPVPRPIQVVGDSPLTCRGAKTRANAAYYTVPSGAGVFATGTMSWACSVYGNTGCRQRSGEERVPEASGEFARQVTENVLRDLRRRPGRPYVPGAGQLRPVRLAAEQDVLRALTVPNQ